MSAGQGSLKLAVLAGDGVGPEVTEPAVRVLESVLQGAGVTLECDRHLVGGAAIDAGGSPLPDSTLAAARSADAVFLGAVGGPRWDHGEHRPEEGLLALRRGLGVFANLRPVRVWPGMEERSPLRAETAAGADVLFIRELTGGAYFGKPQGVGGMTPGRRGVDTIEYAEDEIRRVALIAFRTARERQRRVTSVDKANVLATSRLWRQVVTDVAEQFPEVELEHCLVDSFALRLLLEPRSFDLVVTENLMGDILTDEAAALVGTLGLLPSASGGGDGPWLYEPVHGSAPQIAGKGIANPLGAIATVAMMLEFTLKRRDLATAVGEAVGAVAAGGPTTPDLGGSATTTEVTDAVLERLKRRMAA